MSGFSPSVRLKVRYRSVNYLCEKCGLRHYGEIHHRRPRGMGGSKRPDTNLITNALALCSDCHRGVESDRTDAIMFGWIVPQSGTPADVPVLYLGRWALLMEDGTVSYV